MIREPLVDHASSCPGQTAEVGRFGEIVIEEGGWRIDD